MAFDHKKLNRLINEWTKANKSTQTELGTRTGIKNDLSNFKSGKKKPSAAAIEKLEKFFETSFFTETEQQPVSKKATAKIDGKPRGSIDPGQVSGTTVSIGDSYPVNPQATESVSELMDRLAESEKEWSIDSVSGGFSFVDRLANGDLLIKDKVLGEFYRATKL